MGVWPALGTAWTEKKRRMLEMALKGFFWLPAEPARHDFTRGNG
jgi:hypothetical protein